MASPLSVRIRDAVPAIRDAYYKLILAVGPVGSGKTAAFSKLVEKHGWSRLNVNLRLSERLLDLTQKQRAVRIPTILHETVSAEASEVVLLDNIEMLFAEPLAQDPLRLLQSLARNQIIVAAWPGTMDRACLTYAEPGHPEARRYSDPQALIIHVGGDA